LLEKQEYLRKLSAVDEVLALPQVTELLETHPRGLVVDAVRTIIILIDLRTLLPPDRDDLVKVIREISSED
jgi:chemotaxis signal transduction protein